VGLITISRFVSGSTGTSTEGTTGVTLAVTVVCQQQTITGDDPPPPGSRRWGS
jgi:hypothetical protein